MEDQVDTLHLSLLNIHGHLIAQVNFRSVYIHVVLALAIVGYSHNRYVLSGEGYAGWAVWPSKQDASDATTPPSKEVS